MPKLSVNKNGTWYTAKKFYINIAGTWTLAKKMWINKAGVWQLITFTAPTFLSVDNAVFALSGSLYFNNNGSTNTGNNWLSPVGAGAGAAFWIRFFKTSGGPTPILASGAYTYGSWINMSSTIDLTLTTPSGAYRAANGTYEVSDNAGSTSLGTGTWSLSADGGDGV